MSSEPMKFSSEPTSFDNLSEFCRAIIILVLVWLGSAILRAAGIGHTIQHYICYFVVSSSVLIILLSIKQSEELKKIRERLESRLNDLATQFENVKLRLTRQELRSQMELNSRITAVATS